MCPHLGYPSSDLRWVEGHPSGGTLYAESTDGLKWIKPSLGLVDWNGSKSTLCPL
jgi:hypothetical protein